MSDKSPSLRDAANQAFHLGRAVRLVWDSARGWTAIQLGLVLGQGLLPLVTLYLIKRIVDAVTSAATHPNVGFQGVLPWIGLAFGAAVLNAGLRSLSELASKAQSLQVTDAVSDRLHAQSIAVDLAYYEDPAYYDSLHRAQQEAPYRPAHILSGLVQVVQNGISLLGIAGLLFSFNWLLGVVLFCAALPGAVVRLVYARKLFHFEQKQTETERRAWYYHWLLVDSAFAKEIRLFNLGPVFQERFQKLRRELRHGRLGLTRRRSIADFAVQLLAAAAIFGTLALAASQAVQGLITTGSLVAIYMGFQSGLGFLQAVLGGLAGLYEDNLFLANFYQFLDLQPTIKPPPHPHPVPAPTRQGIRFQEVSFSYPGSGEAALQGVNLSLNPGEVIALVGENGSGKTTLIKLLCGLYRPSSGQITLDGIDLAEFDPLAWRRELSVIFQDYAHYYLTATENIWLGDTNREPEIGQIREAARLAGADAVIENLPHGYGTQLGTWFGEGRELSAGEWQKVALARAFWRPAGIVVLDEPSSALDPLAEAALFERFRQLIHGRSAILISHRFSTVQMADRIYVLDRGQVVEQGSHTELLREGGRYAHLFLAQAGPYRDKELSWESQEMLLRKVPPSM